MESNSKIDEDEVIREFDKRASTVSGINSVLDASDSADVVHANIYRDYLAKYAFFKTIALQGQDVVLDFGCGVGRLSEGVASKVTRVIGVDISSEMIKKARANTSRDNIEYHHIADGTIDQFEETFDKIYSFWVLQHVNDEKLKLLLTSFANKLKSGGKVYVFEQISRNIGANNQIITQRSREDYIAHYEAAGFRLKRTEAVFRMPSYGLDIWNRIKRNNKLLLRLLMWVERLTLNYKKENVDYVTEVFTLVKN